MIITQNDNMSKQIVISRLDKREKGTNLAFEFGISKQQIANTQEQGQDPEIHWQQRDKQKLMKLVNEKQLDQHFYTSPRLFKGRITLSTG